MVLVALDKENEGLRAFFHNNKARSALSLARDRENADNLNDPERSECEQAFDTSRQQAVGKQSGIQLSGDTPHEILTSQLVSLQMTDAKPAVSTGEICDAKHARPEEAVDAAWLLRSAASALASKTDSEASLLARLQNGFLTSIFMLADILERLRVHAEETSVAERPRLVSFSSFDGSNLKPPTWGQRGSRKHDVLENTDESLRYEILERLHDCVVCQSDWFASVEPSNDVTMHEKKLSLIAQFRETLQSALLEGVASIKRFSMQQSASQKSAQDDHQSNKWEGSDLSIKRLTSCCEFLDAELKQLAHGEPMLKRPYAALLNSMIRQQLRSLLDPCTEQSAALLRRLPRGRGREYLGNTTSAAKVLSCALYEMQQLSYVDHDPQIQALLKAELSELETREQVRTLTAQEEECDILSLSEARAAVLHLINHPLGPVPTDQGYTMLQSLLRKARESCCSDLYHFLPLLSLSDLRSELLPSEHSINWLVSFLEWQSPQMPVNERTRSHVKETFGQKSKC